jgi:cytochrome c oxidase assembly factor CtaG
MRMIPGARAARATMRPTARFVRRLRAMSSSPRAILRGPSLVAAVGAAAWLAAAHPVAAHGPVPDDPPTVATLLLGWTFPPLPTLGILAAALWWRWAVGRVNAAHPANPVPRSRSVAFGLGLFAIALALLSGIERYDTTLFSIHMVQHLLLSMVAAPLLVLAAPITLALRLSSPMTRKRWILPVLHSRVVRVLAFPVVAWIAFAGVMWASHFSPLFDAALEDPLLHDVEHALFLGSALLFWWPAVGLDPAPWRMPHPVRALYVFLQMPQNTFLAVVIVNASSVLYPHYATLERAWGPTPLEDQQLAGAIMWVGGDIAFLVAVMAIIVGWVRAEERDTRRSDLRADSERAEIQIRERRLAERLAKERGEV